MAVTESAPAPATAAAWEGDDEWELCHDDGFVYKRRKRSKTDGDTTTTTSGGATLESEVELRKRRRTQKKKTLLKLKDQYNKEIVQWEHLSNTLRCMEERTQNHQEQQRQLQASSSSVILQPEDMRESSSHRLVDDLLFQVEAQEAMIQDLSDLCDIVETMCKAEEERMQQSFFDLPIWGSPRSLLASLSDLDYCNDNDDGV